jgi:protein ImuB
MRSKADRVVEIEKIIAILHQWGIHSLGQFAALEKEDVALRLGPEAVRMWERATGTATRLLKLVEPPESFIESFEFENEIETSEPLLFMLRRFLEQYSSNSPNSDCFGDISQVLQVGHSRGHD